jgi:hypothetical protein
MARPKSVIRGEPASSTRTFGCSYVNTIVGWLVETVTHALEIPVDYIAKVEVSEATSNTKYLGRG